MAERINTPFTNEHFAAYCQRMVGQPIGTAAVGIRQKRAS